MVEDGPDEAPDVQDEAPDHETRPKLFMPKRQYFFAWKSMVQDGQDEAQDGQAEAQTFHVKKSILFCMKEHGPRWPR